MKIQLKSLLTPSFLTLVLIIFNYSLYSNEFTIPEEYWFLNLDNYTDSLLSGYYVTNYSGLDNNIITIIPEFLLTNTIGGLFLSVIPDLHFVMALRTLLIVIGMWILLNKLSLQKFFKVLLIVLYFTTFSTQHLLLYSTRSYSLIFVLYSSILLTSEKIKIKYFILITCVTLILSTPIIANPATYVASLIGIFTIIFALKWYNKVEVKKFIIFHTLSILYLSPFLYFFYFKARIFETQITSVSRLNWLPASSNISKTLFGDGYWAQSSLDSNGVNVFFRWYRPNIYQDFRIWILIIFLIVIVTISLKISKLYKNDLTSNSKSFVRNNWILILFSLFFSYFTTVGSGSSLWIKILTNWPLAAGFREPWTKFEHIALLLFLILISRFFIHAKSKSQINSIITFIFCLLLFLINFSQFKIDYNPFPSTSKNNKHLVQDSFLQRGVFQTYSTDLLISDLEWLNSRKDSSICLNFDNTTNPGNSFYKLIHTFSDFQARGHWPLNFRWNKNFTKDCFSSNEIQFIVDLKSKLKTIPKNCRVVNPHFYNYFVILKCLPKIEVKSQIKVEYINGWDNQEKWGRWSIAEKASFSITSENYFLNFISLRVNENLSPRDIQVYCNDYLVETIRVSNQFRTLRIRIPDKLLVDKGDLIEIKLVLSLSENERLELIRRYDRPIMIALKE
jgi:hypothetical protein